MITITSTSVKDRTLKPIFFNISLILQCCSAPVSELRLEETGRIDDQNDFFLFDCVQLPTCTTKDWLVCIFCLHCTVNRLMNTVTTGILWMLLCIPAGELLVNTLLLRKESILCSPLLQKEIGKKKRSRQFKENGRKVRLGDAICC